MADESKQDDKDGSQPGCSQEPCLAHTARSSDLIDPQQAFCPNVACPDKGVRGRGTIGVHSRKERRYRCRTCGQTYAATRGTPYYRLHHAAELLTMVVTLLSLGLSAASHRCGLWSG